MGKPYGGGKPKFNEFISPIGMIVHLYHDKPQLKTKDQNGKIPDIDEKTGIQIAEYKATLAWKKTRIAELQDLITLANTTKGEAWPESIPSPQNPQPFFQLEPFFRDGDNPAHNTKNKEYLRGCYYLNFKQRADAKLVNPNLPPNAPNNVLYSGAPGLLGPHGPEDILMPQDIWAGCTGRVSGIMFGTEYAGRNFISVRLNNIQKYDEGDGTRIGGGGRPTAASQFGALKDGPAGGLGSGFPGLGTPVGGGLVPPSSGAFPATGAYPAQDYSPNPFGNASTSLSAAPAQNPFGVSTPFPTNRIL